MRAVDAWRQLLPPHVEVSAGPPLNDPPAITLAERQSAGTMGQARLLEFSTGRAYAKQALSKLGFLDVELPMGADRAPVWPTGVTGSITHATRSADRHFAAVVARACTDRQIGIDAEYVDNIHPKNWSQFLTARELGDVLELPVPARKIVATAIWCVKEATIKSTERVVDPLDFQVGPQFPLADVLQSWRITFLDRPTHLEPIEAKTLHLPGIILGVVMPSELRMYPSARQTTGGLRAGGGDEPARQPNT